MWPLLILNSRTLGWFNQQKAILSRLWHNCYPIWRHLKSELPDTRDPVLRPHLKFSDQKCFNYIISQSALVSGILNIFSTNFQCSLCDIGTVKFFPPAECWLVNRNFRGASHMHGDLWLKTFKHSTYRTLYYM